MIVSLLSGGLGNQMFQIANGYAYALKHQMDFAVNFQLANCPNQGNKASFYRDNFFKKIPGTDLVPKQVYKEPRFRFCEIPVLNGDCLFQGYFQSEKYFDGFQEEVKNLFEFPDEAKDNVEKFLEGLKKPVLGIHVRRGDYVKFQNVHAKCGNSYYSQASGLIGDYGSSVVCTDDWKGVIEELKFSKAVPSPFQNELEDMYFLSRCDSLVLCNSSFSWWGSFLGNASKNIVPRKWFNCYPFQEYKDIFREGWTLI